LLEEIWRKETSETETEKEDEKQAVQAKEESEGT
jgi:hypothetical protein